MQVQNYGENPQKPNIFSQIQGWRKNRANEVTNAELKYADRFRSDKTSADEVKQWVWLLLIAVTGVTIFLAVQYYTDVFAATVGAEVATVLAIACAIAVEIGKIKLSRKVVHAAVFGWWSRSWADLGLWSIVLGLAGGCFWWSVTVSMRGMREYAANKAETTVQRPKLADEVAAATAAIDAQIKAETDSRAKAEASKYKGQQTVYGLKNAGQNNINIAALQAQRATIIDQVTREYQAQDSRRTVRVDALTAFITRCGGWMEFAAFLCILALGFVDFRLIQVIREGMAGSPSPTPSTPTPTNAPTPTTSPTSPNGDFWANLRADVNHAKINNRSATCVTSDTGGTQIFPQSTVMGPDEILKAARTELQREAYNLRNGNGDPKTVAKRTYAIFNRVGGYAEKADFKPSETAAAKYYEALQACIELLAYVGHPYEYAAPALTQIENFLPRQHFAAA